MNNGIVCSLRVRDHDTLENVYLYRQLSYSIKTLRKFNKTIPVKIFVSASNLNLDHSKYFDYENIEFIYYDKILSNGWYDSFLNNNFAEVIEHRWVNAFEGLERFNFDNIIYMDTDTRFLKDPELLFDLYGNTEFIWSREDVCITEMDILGITPAMNDGVTVVSKNLLKYKDDCLMGIKKYINETLEHHKPTMDPEVFFHLNWVIIQYAVFNFFNSLGLHRYVDPRHIAMHHEPVHSPSEETIVHHYYTNNILHYLPKEYLLGVEYLYDAWGVQQ